MATKVDGYGPIQLATNDDYDFSGAIGDIERDTDIIIHLEPLGGFDGTILPKTKGVFDPAGSFVAEVYTKNDGTTSAAALAAAGMPQVIRVKTTGKNLRLTLAGRTVGSVRVSFQRAIPA